MNKLVALLLFLMTCVCFAAGQPVFEEEDEEQNPKPKDLVASKSVETKSIGKVHVIVRKDGHVLAKPFIIELRPECDSKVRDWKQLKVRDMESACKVDIGSLKFSEAKSEITIKLHETDAEDYLRRSLRNPGEVVPKCNVTPTLFTFDLKDICKR